MTPLSQLLADFACAPVDDACAQDARHMMKLSLLDWASVTIAGVDEPVSRILREMVLAEGGQGPCALIATDAHAPARAAALANGAASHALDYDDTHFAHIGHPSVAVIPCALAIAQQNGASGRDFLDAALIGVEASVRIGVWLGRAHYQTGFHQTATAGAFGATIAAARLLGLSPDQTRHAIGIASTRAAGLKSQFGTMGKPYHAGLAAQTGVEAATLAQAGFLSNPDGLECEQGFGPTHAGVADETAFSGLGQTWVFETVSHKFHACCHGTHAAIEALLSLRPENRDGAPGYDAIRITTHPRWMRVCNIQVPETGLEVKFSYRMTAAMALLGYDTGALSSFSNQLANCAQLRDLAARVQVDTDDTLPETAARVCVTTPDGHMHHADHDLDAPLALATRRQKLRAKSGALLGGQKADDLWAAINAPHGPDLAMFFSAVSPGAD